MKKGEKSLKVMYWEWLRWITTLEKFNKINFFCPSQSLEDLKTCLSVPSFEQRNSKLPFWTFPSNLALKMLLKADFRTICQLFKITQLSCHSITRKELWKSRNCTDLEIRKCAFVFIFSLFDLEQTTSPFNSRIFLTYNIGEQHLPFLPRDAWRSTGMGWIDAHQIGNIMIACTLSSERKGLFLRSLHSGSTAQRVGFRMRHIWDHSPVLPLTILPYDICVLVSSVK